MKYKYSERQKSEFSAKFKPLNMEERNRYCILSAMGGVYSYLVIPLTIGKALIDNLKHKNLFLALSMFGVVGVLGWWFQKTSELGQSGRMKLFKHHLIDLRTLQPVTGFRFHQYRVLNCLTSCLALLHQGFNLIFRGRPGPLSSNLELNDYKGDFVRAMEGPQDVESKKADSDGASGSKAEKPRIPTKLEAEIHKKSQFLSRFDEKMGIVVVVERQADSDDGKIKIDDSEQSIPVSEDVVSKEVRKYFN